MSAPCHYCGDTKEEHRPYGPGGASVCFSCASADEHFDQTFQAFNALLDAAIEKSNVVVIGGEDGPRPLTP